MYPPVEIIFWIFSFFIKKNDFIIKNKIMIKLKGNKSILLNFGVLIILNLYSLLFKYFKPLLSVVIIRLALLYKCS